MATDLTDDLTGGPLAHEPETPESARARYPLAVETAYEVADAVAYRPGRRRRHVFDFDDGLRLIVSREILGDEVIHVSASAAEGSPLFADVKAMGRLLLGSFLALAETRFREISGHAGEMRFLGLTPRGIPHWVCPTRRL